MRLPSEISLKRYARFLFWAGGLGLAFLQAWSNRYAMNPDGVSYLDMADAYLRGDWGMAINAQWSPLYSWLLSIVFFVFDPSPFWEFPAAHLINFLVYIFAAGCFEFLLNELAATNSATNSATESTRQEALGRLLPEWAWRIIAYALFIWSSLELISLKVLSPDLLVAAFVYLAAAILLRIRRGGDSYVTFAVLGVVLGFGYLAKAPMFIMAFVFLTMSLVAAGGIRRMAPKAIVALIVFLSLSAPFIAAISLTKGRLTFGDSARLNYAWFVNGVPRFAHWQGSDPEKGQPSHPTRKISTNPAIYEFASPFKATYPPWYDPSYWYEGIRPRFELKAQVSLLASVAPIWADILLNMHMGIFTIGFLLICLTRRSWPSFKDLGAHWVLLVPAATACVMFSLVNLEPRYVSPFILLSWVAVLPRIRLNVLARSQAVLAGVIMLLVGISLAPVVVRTVMSVVGDTPVTSNKKQLQVAEALHHLGLGEGDPVASVGDSFRAYWARLARVRIVAEVPSKGLENEIAAGDVDSFWAGDEAARQNAINIFASLGAKAVVTDYIPDPSKGAGWEKIDDTQYYVYKIVDR